MVADEDLGLLEKIVKEWREDEVGEGEREGEVRGGNGKEEIGVER